MGALDNAAEDKMADAMLQQAQKGELQTVQDELGKLDPMTRSDIVNKFNADMNGKALTDNGTLPVVYLIADQDQDTKSRLTNAGAALVGDKDAKSGYSLAIKDGANESQATREDFSKNYGASLLQDQVKMGDAAGVRATENAMKSPADRADIIARVRHQEAEEQSVLGPTHSLPADTPTTPQAEAPADRPTQASGQPQETQATRPEPSGQPQEASATRPEASGQPQEAPATRPEAHAPAETIAPSGQTGQNSIDNLIQEIAQLLVSNGGKAGELQGVLDTLLKEHPELKKALDKQVQKDKDEVQNTAHYAEQHGFDHEFRSMYDKLPKGLQDQVKATYTQDLLKAGKDDAATVAANFDTNTHPADV